MDEIDKSFMVKPVVDEQSLKAQRELEERFARELELRRKRKGINSEQRALIEAEIREVRRRVEEMYSNRAYLLNPDTMLMYRWDLAMLLVVLFCMIWTPFEVAFLPTRFDTRFAVNRLLDAFFFSDFLATCVRTFEDPVSGKRVRNRRRIIMRYFKSRMVLDVMLSAGCFVADTVAAAAGESNVLGRWEMVRLLRLTHLTKVTTLARRVVEHFGPGRVSWTYNELALARFLGVIGLVVHLMSCSWRLVIEIESSNDDFFDSWIMREGVFHESPGHLYVICIYWATTTITTIGYGDVANPGTPLERALAVVVMLCGALVWAYIIGGVTAVVSSFNMEELTFSEQMDQLNQYMSSKHMAPQLRERLRYYFRHRRSLEQDNGYAALLEKMSPTLRGEVARSVSRQWLRRVPWLNNGSLGFIASVAIALQPELYAPREVIAGAQLRVLTRGIVAKNSRIYTSGSVWGIDIILTSSTLKNLHPARSLTFSHLLSLDSEALDELLELYPKERARIRASAIWLGLKRSFIRYAQQMKTGRQIIHRIAEEARVLNVDVERVFRAFDSRGRESLNNKEFDQAIRTLGYAGPKVLLEVILSRFDKDGDGSVDYPEFVNYFMHDFAFDGDVQAEDKNAYIEHLDFKRLTKVKRLQDMSPPGSSTTLKDLKDLRTVLADVEADGSTRAPHRVGSRGGKKSTVSRTASLTDEDTWVDDEGNASDAVVIRRPTGGPALPTPAVQRRPSGAGLLASRNPAQAAARAAPQRSSSSYRGNVKRTKSSRADAQSASTFSLGSVSKDSKASELNRDSSILVRLVDAQRARIKKEESKGTRGLFDTGGGDALGASVEQLEKLFSKHMKRVSKQLRRDVRAQLFRAGVLATNEASDSDGSDGGSGGGSSDDGDGIGNRRASSSGDSFGVLHEADEDSDEGGILGSLL